MKNRFSDIKQREALTLRKFKRRDQDFDMEEISKEIASTSLETSIYVGADSKQFTKNGVKMVAYVVSIVIHKDSNAGGVLHRSVKFDRDYGNMRQRLMTEVYMAGAAAAELADVIGERPFAVHLDINPDPSHKSSICEKEANGFILGTVGFRPKMKPEAFAATAVADRHAKKLGKK